MIIAEEFEACDDATGCWVFRGAWADLTANEVRTEVLKHLVDKQLLAWANVKHEHPMTFFADNARVEFKRDWRVRRVAAGRILPTG